MVDNFRITQDIPQSAGEVEWPEVVSEYCCWCDERIAPGQRIYSLNRHTSERLSDSDIFCSAQCFMEHCEEYYMDWRVNE